MKLKKFRIYNYRCIQDSGDCYLASDFTTLIGKNESGKTAILEALRDFDQEYNSISKQAIPLSGGQGEPTIELTFCPDPQELDAILEETQVKVNDVARRQILEYGICLAKSASGTYRLKDEYIGLPVPEPTPPVQSSGFELIRAKKQRLDELMSGFPMPDMKTADGSNLQDLVRDLRGLVKSRLGFIHEEEKKTEIVAILQEMARTVNENEEQEIKQTPKDKFTWAVLQKLPRFIFFSDFKDILPFEIEIDALKKNQTVGDFARIANLDLDSIIKAEDTQSRINILNRASATISGDFLGHWAQSKMEIIVRPEGNKLLFGIKESDGTDFFKVEQRSKGFQWFLSFYLRLNRHSADKIVVLIDEPGMNLHPTAQRDILKILTEQSSGNMQVIFSTHSSALIDPDRADRVRFVIKTKGKGSTIKADRNDGVDKESAMPLIIAASLGAASEPSAGTEKTTEQQSSFATDETIRAQGRISAFPPKVEVPNNITTLMQSSVEAVATVQVPTVERPAQPIEPATPILEPLVAASVDAAAPKLTVIEPVVQSAESAPDPSTASEPRRSSLFRVFRK